MRCLDTRHSQPIIPVRDYSQGRGISDNGCWRDGRRAKALGGWATRMGSRLRAHAKCDVRLNRCAQLSARANPRLPECGCVQLECIEPTHCSTKNHASSNIGELTCSLRNDYRLIRLEIGACPVSAPVSALSIGSIAPGRATPARGRRSDTRNARRSTSFVRRHK